jgi:hypothetical protein
MTEFRNAGRNGAVSRRAVMAGMAGAALTGVAGGAGFVAGAWAQGSYRINLGGYSGPELTSEPVTLRFMRQDFTPDVNALLESAYAEFMAAYPNITIVEEKVPYGDLQKKLMVYVASGSAPDIMMGRTDFTDAYHAGGIALPLQDFISADYMNDIPDNLRASASADGNLYSLPWEVSVMMLYFNRDLFEKAGVAPPPEVTGLDGGWSAEEFIANLEELNAKLKEGGDRQSWAVGAAAQGNGGPGANYSQVESIWIRSQGDPACRHQRGRAQCFRLYRHGRSNQGDALLPEHVRKRADAAGPGAEPVYRRFFCHVFWRAEFLQPLSCAGQGATVQLGCLVAAPGQHRLQRQWLGCAAGVVQIPQSCRGGRASVLPLQ